MHLEKSNRGIFEFANGVTNERFKCMCAPLIYNYGEGIEREMRGVRKEGTSIAKRMLMGRPDDVRRVAKILTTKRNPSQNSQCGCL